MIYVDVFQAFSVVFEKAIDRAEPAEEVKARVDNLIDCITYSVFMYTARGLFEKDKITFTAQMTFQVSFYGPVEVGNICIVFIIIDFSITN